MARKLRGVLGSESGNSHSKLASEYLIVDLNTKKGMVKITLWEDGRLEIVAVPVIEINKGGAVTNSDKMVELLSVNISELDIYVGESMQ